MKLLMQLKIVTIYHNNSFKYLSVRIIFNHIFYKKMPHLAAFLLFQSKVLNYEARARESTSLI